MKDSNEVIKEFNEIVNMTASELEKWLKSDDSQSAGWPKDEGDGGESVGHDSGRKIVEILKSNPDKKEDKYTDDQISHMRKVVSYCKRHLAQEESANAKKSTEEVKKTKSYASLKNWGHDPLKKRSDSKGGMEDDKQEQEEEEAVDEKEEDAKDDDEDDDNEQEDDDKEVGEKRKKSANTQSSPSKKRETRQGKASSNNNSDNKNGNEKKEKEDDNDEEEEEEDDAGDGDDDQDKENGDSGKTPKKGPKPGDTVSWNWGNGNPEGKVLDVKAEKTSVKTKRGNEVTRDGNPEDPAVVLDTGKSKAIKSNHELN